MVVGGVIALMLFQQGEPVKDAAGPAKVETVEKVSGSLKVSSKPDGASIFVNGKDYGKTPAVLSDLPLGEELTVRIEKRGYENVVLPIKLSKNRPTAPVNVTLSKE